MNDVDLALTQISKIRAQLAAQTRFLGLSPEFNLLMGALALIVALFQMFAIPPQNNLGFIAVWASVLLASLGIAAVDAVSRARREHGSMAANVLGAVVQKAFPFLVVAVLMTWVLCQFAVESIWLLPGLWQLLIALLGFAILSSLPRVMAWIVCWYLLCGAVVLVVAAQTRVLSPWMMGLPFTIGQVAVGLILVKHKEGQGV